MKPSLINPRYIIVLFALLAFAPTLRVGFLVDDHRVIENNVTLTRWSWQDIREDFASNVFHDATEANYYRPLFNCLLRAEHSLWRFQPFGYHAINLLFHIACALALFQLLTTLGMSQNIALAAASLFAVHPVATDLMMVASAGEEQMAYFLSLLSILLAQGGRRRYGGALLVFCAALFTKESAMMTPILFAAVLIAKGSPLKEHRRWIPLAALALLYYGWHRHVMGPTISSSDWHQVFPFFLHAFPQILARYIAVYFWPFSLHYPRLIQPLSQPWPLFWIGWGLLMALGIRVWGRMAVFCLIWMVAGLLPKTPVMIRGFSMMDHWFYPSSLGVLLPLAAGLNALSDSSGICRSRFGKTVYFALLSIWTLFVYFHVRIRGSDEAMYRWTIRFEPRIISARYKLGATLLNRGRPDLALPYMEQAYALNPDDPVNINGLAVALFQLGQHDRAIALMEHLVAKDPSDRAGKELLEKMRKLSRGPR